MKSEIKPKIVSKARLKRYLANPEKCPYCNSENLNAYGFDAGLDTVWRNINCNNCQRGWTETLTLSGINNAYKSFK